MEEVTETRETLDIYKPIEIKKELSDNSDMEFECVASNDGIFELIPFMAKLLSNLKCSFYSRNNAIVITSIEMVNVYELIDRLIKNRIRPSRMDCVSDSTFTILIGDDQFTKSPSQSNKVNMSIVKFLAHMAIVTECCSLSLQLEEDEIHIRSITYENLASLMIRLKQYDIRPKQVDSLKESVFSLVFNDQSFSNCAKMLKLPVSSDLIPGSVLNIRRPRICPNYLRDYVVENKEEPAVSGLDLIQSFGSRPNLNTAAENNINNKSHSPSGLNKMADFPNFFVKRGRGRPRIRPRPTDISLDSNQTKKPRGRPRRSEIIPNIISKSNSFINIQPRAMSVQELETCFAKFLESEGCQQK